MINKVSGLSFSQSVSSNHSPSFGFAKISDAGRRIADTFGYPKNVFLDADMYKKQGWFKESALSKQMRQNNNFVDVCVTYGCSNNPRTNASFIKSQIMVPALYDKIGKNVSQEDYEKGLRTLYNSNYDNPELSLKETKALLNMVKDTMSESEFAKQAGLLEVGTYNQEY